MNKLEYSKEDLIEMQNDIDKLQQENKQLKEIIDKAIDMCIVVYGGNDDYYVNRLKNIKKELEKGNSNE